VALARRLPAHRETWMGGALATPAAWASYA
jgi:hypothetical protein